MIALEGTARRTECARCQAPGPDGAGRLYLSPPTPEALAVLADYFAAAGVTCDPVAPGVLGVDLSPGLLARMAEELPGRLTDTQAATTKALRLRPGVTPSLADLMNTKPLSAVFDGVRYQWLADLLREDRLVTHFQPIVPAADPGTVFGYEALSRGEDASGGPVPPRDLFAAARSADLLALLDRQARVTAIRSFVRAAVPASARLFVNFNPTAIYTPAHCLRTTFRAIADVGLSADRVVFEVVESDEVRDTAHLTGLIETYRSAGFGVALDDVGAGYSSLNLLARLRPDYVKVDMGLTRNVDRDGYKAAVVGKLLEMARALGVRTVVEGVETVGEWLWARDHGADYVQGYLFARPASAPPRPMRPSLAGPGGDRTPTAL